MKFHTLFSIFILLLLAGCSLDWDKITEPNPPYWSTHLEIPFPTQSIGADEIMEKVDDPDNAISQIPNPTKLDGDSILYAFQKIEEIEKETISFENMGIDPFTDEMGSELGTIELSPIPETEAPPFTLGELNPSLNAFNGMDATIPVFELETIQKSFEFDNFQEATFENGNLIITIDNQLPIDLDSIYIRLKEIDNSVIDEVLILQIPAGESKNGTIDLANKTLPQTIEIEVDGESPGTGTAPEDKVPIDINDYFSVKISSGALEVSSAIAQIPEQSNPISGSGNMLLPMSEHRVANAVFERAMLEITINNQLDLASELNMQIDNILDSSLASVPINIPLEQFEIANYTLDLTGYIFSLYEGNDFTEFNDGEKQQVSYEYNVVMEQPDEGDFRTVSKTDQIEVSVRFYGNDSDSTISFSQIKGKIAQIKEEIGPITQSTPKLPEELNDFELLDEYVDMSLFLQIDNIGLPILVDLIIKAENQDTSIERSQSHDFSTSPEMKIDNAAELINIRPESIVVSGEAIVGDSTVFSTINIVDAIYMEGYFSIDIPFVFKVQSGTVVELDPTLSTPENFDALPVGIEDIETMQLMIDYDNQFGFRTKITVLAASDTLHFADSSLVKPDTLIHSLLLDQNEPNGNDSVILDQELMEFFKDSIYFKTKLDLWGDKIFFQSPDSLILKLSASIDYLINAPDSTGTDDE